MNTIKSLQTIVGKSHVITAPDQSLRYRKGYRSGLGDALAVVLPGTLMELWEVLQVLHDHNIIIIMQASNTSLTEGAVPAPGYDREAVVVNGSRIKGLDIINHGKEVLAFPGTTLYKLENDLKAINREPHSVIGSSNLGASVIGGINNNSGGALIQRGPAYTEQALYAQIDENNELKLVNHLGISLGNSPEEMIANLENHQFDIDNVPHNHNRIGRNRDYESRVRDINAATPTRFNADPNELYEVSGSAGKLAAFAVRLDTFPSEGTSQVFYIGTNNPDVLERLRRHILANFTHLPVSGEYMHKDAYMLAKKYGKDSLIVIETLGTNVLPYLFGMKATTERMLDRVPIFKPYFPDRVLQHLGQLFPNQLPTRIESYTEQYEHYLQLKMAGDGIAEAKSFLQDFFAHEDGGYLELSAKEAELVATHRYVTAGVAIRYEEVFQDKNVEILPLDIAIPRNEFNWFEKLPPEIENKIQYKLYYGHFLDHVMHQDYILKPGVDGHKLKQDMLALLDKRGIIYPAEHNVGHLYEAAPALVAHYKKNDPTNSFNPGIGKTTMQKYWGNY